MKFLKFQSKTVLVFSLIFYFLAIAILLWSVVKSGFYFQFNPDEFFNANTIYLMFKGYKPYVDFYTVYSPILHWLLSPLFIVFGFTFKAIYASRIVLIVLYITRLFLLFFLVKRVFNIRVAFISIPLFMLDPFMVFAAMQIRPENLMLVFYTLFLLVFSYTYESKSRKMWFFSGLLLGVTFLINIKIIPSLVAFGLVLVYFVFQNKLFSKLLLFINGFCLTLLIFFAYFLIRGYLPEMFLHVFLDPFKLNNSIPYPTWLGYFYFSNPTIYGVDGKSLNWMYAWLLPVLGFAGGYKSLFIFKSSSHYIMKIILFLSLFLQWFSMLFIHSVFIQYYLPLNWLYAVFGAVVVDDVLFKIELAKLIKFGTAVALIVLFILLIRISFIANLNRSQWTAQQQINEMQTIWKLIPENQPVFPNMIFRPPVYPVLWGSTFAKYMRDRYPPVYLAIKKHKLPTLLDMSNEYFSFLDNDSQDYILKNYKKDTENPLIWRKIK